MIDRDGLEQILHFVSKRWIDITRNQDNKAMKTLPNNFWMNSSNNYNLKSSQMKADECDAAGYIADAVTSALLFWNPIGSIIGGLAASYIAEENCRS